MRGMGVMGKGLTQGVRGVLVWWRAGDQARGLRAQGGHLVARHDGARDGDRQAPVAELLQQIRRHD
jgi:hypothetical protein